MWRGRQISRRTKTTMAEKGQETQWRPEKYINGIKVMTGGREGLVAQPGAETGDKNK